ncbi:hypothetical protein B0920_17160 [Massilia sp. KIM]|jgi:hypothetical protein|uniref:putative signal transducing protein n=1 Tax=Massilia sp. KIM TaxID=1955422 RepID=UPI00099014D3|nr:DUF2007 domain-containing protein [Massilia sp. KIM]OON60693.1 hypothetical protein B0920_17160 [Massilia sp. KIM]
METLALDAWLAAHPEIEQIPGRDLFIVARYMVPLDANLAQGCLVAAGVPAVLADAHLMQTDLLLAPALGGVRVLVPAEFLVQAAAVLDGLARGDYALDDDTTYG